MKTRRATSNSRNLQTIGWSSARARLNTFSRVLRGASRTDGYVRLMVIYAAFIPREGTTYNVLVGLLTPKLNQAGLLTVGGRQRPKTAMALQAAPDRSMLGHSGGAVPDLHRSSLYVGSKTFETDHQHTIH